MARRDPHLLLSGEPKHPFLTAEAAIRVAKEITARDSVDISIYRCPGCPAWHVGRTPRWKYLRVSYDQSLTDELGDRAAGCLLAENKGRADHREAVIRQRAMAAYIRRLIDARGPYDPHQARGPW